MRTKLFTSLYFFLALSFLISCKSKDGSNDSAKIKVEFGNSIDNFTNLIESVEYIPLETDSAHVVGHNPLLYVGDNSYYIVDNVMASNIFRYDLEGKFLNRIGNKGRGPGEYLEITGFQLLQDTVIVFSWGGDKVIKYTPSGELIEERLLPRMGQQSYYLSDGYLAYFGFTSRSGRLFYIGRDTSITKEYLVEEKNKKRVSSLSRTIFSSYQNIVFIRDTDEPHVLMYKDGILDVYHLFDFGKYSLPKDFDKYDRAKVLEFLEKEEYAEVFKFLKTSKFEAVGIRVHAHDTTIFTEIYGLNYNNIWHWFDAGNYYEHPLAGMLKDAKEESLYFLVFPHLVEKLKDQLNHYAVNPGVLEGVTDESNYVIVKINLKRELFTN